ncbi:MAG: AMP-binding protein [bacterium]|nr:acyl-CoA synthetase [Gammaproteobacteria bacterium]HIL94318.1 acyl-CoA synthetase [Pseudomonadales bacterium]
MYPGHWSTVFPDKAAVIHAGTGQTVTYKELDDRSNQLAQLMWSLGLRKGDHISIFMENDVRYFEVVWAAFRSGLYLTTVNRYLTDEEAGYIIENSESRLVVTSNYLSEIANNLHQFCPDVERWLMVGDATEGYEDYEAAIAEFPAEKLPEEPAGTFLLYSSGTTGRPKGILRPLSGTSITDDAGPIGALQSVLWGFDENSVYLSPAPLYHSAPVGFCIGTHTLGGTVIMMPRFNEVEALRAIERYQVTHSQWVPTMFTRLLKMDAAERANYDLSSHKVAIHAAAPCPRKVKQQMFDWWGSIIYEYYGGTELNGFTHVTPEAWLTKPGTVGQSLLGVIHICDEDGKELPNGEPGMVYFELPEMPFEYLKDAAKTKDSQHPQHSNWSALGDVGYVDDDGFLFLTDRATFMIISGGVNIYPQEIEDAMIMHPKIADVAVFGVPNEEMGEEVKAVVQVEAGIVPDDALAEELMAYAREHVAHYKCPRSVDFEEELPRLPTGKLYKRLLKDRYWGKKDTRIV